MQIKLTKPIRINLIRSIQNPYNLQLQIQFKHLCNLYTMFVTKG